MKYIDYFLKTDTQEEMVTLLSSIGLDWDTSMGMESSFRLDVEVEQTLIDTEGNETTEIVNQKARVYISMIGDLPELDIDGNIIYTGEGEDISIVMSGKYHANVRSTHELNINESIIVTPQKPQRKFA